MKRMKLPTIAEVKAMLDKQKPPFTLDEILAGPPEGGPKIIDYIAAPKENNAKQNRTTE